MDLLPDFSASIDRNLDHRINCVRTTSRNSDKRTNALLHTEDTSHDGGNGNYGSMDPGNLHTLHNWNIRKDT